MVNKPSRSISFVCSYVGILCYEIFSGGKSPYATLTNPQVAEEVSFYYIVQINRRSGEERYFVFVIIN
jgi:hypothetical protein